MSDKVPLVDAEEAIMNGVFELTSVEVGALCEALFVTKLVVDGTVA